MMAMGPFTTGSHNIRRFARGICQFLLVLLGSRWQGDLANTVKEVGQGTASLPTFAWGLQPVERDGTGVGGC